MKERYLQHLDITIIMKNIKNMDIDRKPDKIILNGVEGEAFIPESVKKTLKKKGNVFIFGS